MTVNTNHIAAFPLADYRPALWERWVALRNGDVAQAEEIVAPTLILHTSGIPGRLTRTSGEREGQAVRAGRHRAGGRRALLSWVSALHAAVPSGRLTVQVGPIISEGLIAGRWVFSRDGREDGSLTGAAGNAITGTDILRVEDGQIIELWINHNLLGQTASPEMVAA